MRNSPEPITVFATSCPSPTAILAEQRETLTAMLLEVRTSTALGLLQANDAPVTQVALNCGFKSHSHFSKVFRDRFGFAPRDLRQVEA